MFLLLVVVLNVSGAPWNPHLVPSLPLPLPPPSCTSHYPTPLPSRITIEQADEIKQCLLRLADWHALVVRRERIRLHEDEIRKKHAKIL